MLSFEERSELLRRARAAVAKALGLPSGQNTMLESRLLDASMGLFVTLHRFGALRGCIGYIEGMDLPMHRLVEEAAVNAAFHDPRFPPVSVEEFGGITFELSVLSPLQPLQDPEHITIGKHGLLLECGSARGLLLPQVATEYGWGPIEFLNNTARKAGLPTRAWQREDAKLWSFTAEIFAEETVRQKEPR